MNDNLTLDLFAIPVYTTMGEKARFDLVANPNKPVLLAMFAHAESRESLFLDVVLPAFLAHAFLLNCC